MPTAASCFDPCPLRPVAVATTEGEGLGSAQGLQPQPNPPARSAPCSPSSLSQHVHITLRRASSCRPNRPAAVLLLLRDRPGALKPAHPPLRSAAGGDCAGVCGRQEGLAGRAHPRRRVLDLSEDHALPSRRRGKHTLTLSS